MHPATCYTKETGPCKMLFSTTASPISNVTFAFMCLYMSSWIHMCNRSSNPSVDSATLQILFPEYPSNTSIPSVPELSLPNLMGNSFFMWAFHSSFCCKNATASVWFTCLNGFMWPHLIRNQEIFWLCELNIPCIRIWCTSQGGQQVWPV